KKLHSWIFIDHYLHSNPSLSIKLIRAYAAFGETKVARQVFDEVTDKNVVFFNVMIRSYVNNHMYPDALLVYKSMSSHGHDADHYTYPCVLKACSASNNLRVGLQIHCVILKVGQDSNLFVGNGLVAMYGKCGCLLEARRALDELPSRDVVSWNSMVAGYAQNGKFDEALEVCREMESLRFRPNADAFSIASILPACGALSALFLGRKIYEYVERKKLMPNLLLENALIDMYAKCGCLLEAREVFDHMKFRDVVTWTSMISAYGTNGQGRDAVALFSKMQDSGLFPDSIAFVSVLSACTCSGLQAMQDGKEIHGHAIILGLHSDVYICTALLDFYAKCGDLVEAHRVFDTMFRRDVVAWNAMIAGYSLHGLYNETIGLFVEMQKDRVCPNSSSIVTVLPIIGQVNALRQGKAMHGYCLRRSFNNDVVLATGLLDMYGKCHCISYASRIFCVMGIKNEITWSAMIGAYVSCDLMREVLEIFYQMLLEEAMTPTPITLVTVLQACTKLTFFSRGRCLHCYTVKSGSISDIMVGNSLLAMYAKNGILDDAIRFFDQMNLKDDVSYNAIISGCMQNGNAEEALRIFHKMQLSGVEPNSTTMLGVLPACSHLATLQHGVCAHGCLIARGLAANSLISNALIVMYSKCGKIDIARKVFDKMHEQDIVSWNSMIFGYGIHGHGMEALSIFHDMLASGLKPDDVTFICLLSACSHSGLVMEGEFYFNAMSQEYNIIPRMDHYLCMADLLSRAGLLSQARSFIERMPYEPDVRIWNVLLAACRIHKNIELGEEVSKKIQRIGPYGTGNFVLLSNMYSAVGRWDDAAHIRIVQKDQGFKKIPGCSWIEVNGFVHAFVGGDRSHPKLSQINQKLDELLAEMKRLGYQAESSFVLQDVEEEEKERILLYHSEKLAIAFGIISLRPSKPIIVTKNLRVCGDCHAAMKFITLITKRAITVRDTSRFHHFRDGNCNCGDFW
ncbi:PPR domain-containing protein/PPR_2 domain-containing protein/DYW_deaminase domain-containing protein, partial [Cephalotus follicularis]